MFWSDITTDTIHRANLDGSGEEVIAESCIGNVGTYVMHCQYSHCLKFITELIYLLPKHR